MFEFQRYFLISSIEYLIGRRGADQRRAIITLLELVLLAPV
jgi:hypothetical protein